MLESNPTIITIKDKYMTLEMDVSENTANEFLSKIVKLMKTTGYHDISILDALRDVTDEHSEFLMSIKHYQGEL